MDNGAEGMELVKKIGLRGLQINMGSEGKDLHLRKSEMQQAYKESAKKLGTQFSGIALGELNVVPYKAEARAES